MTIARRYLPLFTQEENWIVRPDLYLLARMGAPDSEDEEVIRQVHEAMCRSDNSRENLDSFGKNLERNHIRKNVRERVMAGEVVLEMVRITATTQRPPSENKSIRLAAANHLKKFQRSSEPSLARDFRRGFSNFRNTAHLQAAMVLGAPNIADVECSLSNLVQFLARARALEHFIDNNLTSTNFKWSPWRIPPRIPANFKINLVSLTDQELRMIGEVRHPN